jgi:transcription initiation factor TFIID subunit 1
MPSSDEENENQSSDDDGDLSNSPDNNDDDSQSSQEDGGGGGRRPSGLNLTGFLFGNIDKEGKLEADILDEESKRQLGTLGRFGLMSILQNVIREDDSGSKDQSTDSEDDGTKSPTAEDYSDINELAEDEGGPYLDDSILMPPPPTPTSKSLSASEAKKRLETPLAAMLPSKYANIDVRELFPDFRPDKVLCFSRLFGPGKPSSLPQIWRGVKKKRKKKKSPDSEDYVEEEVECIEITFKFGTTPTPDKCRPDDEERFPKPLEDPNALNNIKNSDDDKGPNVADWRFGPAQLWYDILGVPETGKQIFSTFVIRA